MIKVWRLWVGGKSYKTYDRIERLKNAIHLKIEQRIPFELEELIVTERRMISADELFGSPACPECGHYPKKDDHYSHDYYCSRNPYKPRY